MTHKHEEAHLGMIHNLKVEDNQAVIVGLHFYPRDHG